MGGVLKVRLFGDHWGKIITDDVMMAVFRMGMHELSNPVLQIQGVYRRN